MKTRITLATVLGAAMLVVMLGCEPPDNDTRYDNGTNDTTQPRDDAPRQTPRGPMPDDY